MGFVRIAILGVALAASVGCAQTPSVEDNAANVAQGRSRYTLMCARCHGLNLVSNGLGTDLRTFPQEAKERFSQSVTNGIRAMPAWESSLKAGDLDAMWAYIGSVNGWPVK